ncbi:MAG: YdcF family protein [Actinobacteria bacterium]|nr:MAG: YdcF family protein [Actinomycetota bacterium]
MRSAIVVPGHARRGRISSLCLELVREAERIAAATEVDAVVFSGWAPRGGNSEADQMRAAWRGPDVELVLEPTARVTAENAARTLPLLVARGIEHAVVVCAPLHLFRARFFFSRVYGAHGIATEFRAVTAGRTLHALLWELGATPAIRRHLRAARTELER